MDKLRQQIDDIDRKITDLFEQRMDVVKGVIDYKIKNNLPILNSSREAAVIEKNVGYLKNKEYAPYLKEFYQGLMDVSKRMQANIANLSDAIGFQGEKGSFSHEATLKFLADKNCPVDKASCEIKNYPTFDSLMNALLNDDVKYIVIPFENTSTGAVTDVYDLLTQYDFYINGEVLVHVNHNLLVKEGVKLSDIKEIYSHPQAFMQSKEFLKNLPARQIPYYNTAIAAKFVSESDRTDIAAIASEQAAAYYGLKVMEHNINYNNNNITKFIVLSKTPLSTENANKVSAIISIQHKAGSLASIINLFAQNNVNLTKIESRPDLSNPFEYIFFIDFEGNMGNDRIKAMVEKLKESCAKFKYLGNYI